MIDVFHLLTQSNLQGGIWRGWRTFTVQDWQAGDQSSTPESHVRLGLGKKSSEVRVGKKIIFNANAVFVK